MKKELGSNLESEVVILDWDVVGYTQDFIYIQIIFKNPEDIGAYNEFDFIQVTFWGVEFFKS